MAKKEKEQKMSFFYLDEEENKKKKTSKPKKKKTTNKKDDKSTDNTKFSFDKEIIIGVSKKEDDKKNKKNQNKDKNKNKNKKNKNSVKSKKTNTNKETKKNEIKEETKKIEKKKPVKKSKPKKKEKIETPEQLEKKQEKRRKISKILKYVFIVILILTAIVLAMFSPLFNIKEIIVKGNEKISQNEIISLSQVKIDQNIFKLLKSKVADQIKENAYIDDVIISRNLPSKLVIEVKERKPAYMIEYAGSYVYIDKQGYILELTQQKLELPILQGQATDSSEFTAGKRLNKDDLKKLAVVLRIMEIAEINEISNLITRIDMGNLNNIILGFETEGKTAYLGDMSNLLDKMIRVKKILEQEKGKSGEIIVNMDLNKRDSIFRERV